LENQFQLAARLLKTDTLRYTPAGIPVLDVVLQHESIQQENGSPLKVRFELSAKIIGKQAELWQQYLALLAMEGASRDPDLTAPAPTKAHSCGGCSHH